MKTDLLQELIQHLSKAEKRYFTLYASRHIIEEPNPYILLFRLLDKQKIVSKAMFEKEYQTTISLKKFKNIKSYLSKLVLESLEGFYKEKDTEIQLSSYYNQAKIIIKKGLYEQANGLINKGIALAQKYGYHNYIAMFLFLQLKNFSLIKIIFAKNKLIEHPTDLHQKINHHVLIYQEEVAIYALFTEFYDDVMINQKYTKLLEIPSLQKIQEMFNYVDDYTVAGQIVYCEFLALLNIERGNREAGYLMREKMHEKLSQLELKEIDKNAYCNFLLNFAISALVLEKTEKSNELLDVCYDFFIANHKSDLTISKDILGRFFLVKIEYLIVKQQWGKLKEFLKDALLYINEYATVLNAALLKWLRESILESYLRIEDYDACLEGLSIYQEEYKDSPNMKNRIKLDFICIACHYGLENYLFLENYIKKIKRKKYAPANFLMLLKTIEKACKSPDKTSRKNAFRELKEYLQKAYKDKPYVLNKLLGWVNKFC